MKLEYHNGVRITKLHHEMSPLEVAIKNYEEKAREFFSKSNKDLHLTKEERKAKSKEALNYLATDAVTWKALAKFKHSSRFTVLVILQQHSATNRNAQKHSQSCVTKNIIPLPA